MTYTSNNPQPQKIPRLSAKETERIWRTPGRSGHPICGIVIGSSWHEPVACAYPPDHTGDHSWASIPQFDPAKRLLEQLQSAEEQRQFAVDRADVEMDQRQRLRKYATELEHRLRDLGEKV